MSKEWTRWPTSRAVFDAIRNEHMTRLRVFSSFSNPEGGYMGFSGRGEMETEWGLEGTDYPILGANTTWDIFDEYDPTTGQRKVGERSTTYWLCIAIEQGET
jgi:hypothetical protein